MKLSELIPLLKVAATKGAENALSNVKQVSARISKSQAYRRFGRTNVDRWIRESLLTNTTKHIDRTKLEAIAHASNRITYLPVADR